MKNRNGVIKIKPTEIVLLILIEICTVFFILSTVAQLNFRSNIINGYEKTYPIKDGLFINLREIENYEKMDIKDVPDLMLERNLYKFLTTDNDMIETVYYNVSELYEANFIGIEKTDEKDLKEADSNDIYYFFVNKAYYDDYMVNYIDGNGFKAESFFSKDKKNTPIIMGNNFKKTYKIGQVIESKGLDKRFQVVGFLEKDRFIFDGTGFPSVGIEKLSNAIISPYNEDTLKMAVENNLSMMNEEDHNNEDSLLIYDLPSIISTMMVKVNPNYSLIEVKDKLEEELLNKGLNVQISTITSDINSFINDFDNEIRFNTWLISILGILSIMILVTTINYKIIKFRYNIGVLYSLGATTNNIIKIFFNKLLPSSILALLIGCVVYVTIRKTVYVFFINNISVKDIIIGILIYTCIIAISFMFSIIKIKKIEPVELLREGRE